MIYMNYFSINVIFLLVFSSDSADAGNPPNIRVSVAEKSLVASTLSFTATTLKISLEPVDPTKNTIISITKDSDPNFLNQITFDEGKKDAIIVELNSDKWEGQNTFTIVERQKDSEKVINTFLIKLKNPENIVISNMGGQQHDDINRLNIPLRFTQKIRQVFEKYRPRNKFLEENKVYAARRADIYFVFIDTLRSDYIQYAPVMRKFMQNNIAPPLSISTATATWYSSFSMFHALPAFFTYDYIASRLRQRRPQDFGGFPVRILHHLVTSSARSASRGRALIAQPSTRAQRNGQDFYNHISASTQNYSISVIGPKKTNRFSPSSKEIGTT